MKFATPAQRAKYIAKKFGKSYYFATRFFPKHTRHATYALYAFFRLPDDIVDVSSANSRDAEKELDKFVLLWREALRTPDEQQGSADLQLLRYVAQVFRDYKIPEKYSFDFLQAMMQDCKKSTYSTYKELKHYMYGSASVVGLMMTHVIGFSDKKALPYAQALGEAMQLTNFLRDVGEDWRLRKRIYLPLEDMKKFGVTKRMIQEEHLSPELVSLLKFEIQRARRLYAKALRGIEFLSPAGRLAVRIASTLYEAILDEIEVRDYDVFSERARTSLRRKFVLALPLAMEAVIKKRK